MHNGGTLSWRDGYFLQKGWILYESQTSCQHLSKPRTWKKMSGKKTICPYVHNATWWYVSSIVGTLNFKMPHWIHKLQGNAFGFLNRKMLLRCYQNGFKSWDRKRNFRDSNRINRLSCHHTASCPNNLKRTSVSQSETVVKIVIVLSRVSAKKTNSQ